MITIGKNKLWAIAVLSGAIALCGVVIFCVIRKPSKEVIFSKSDESSEPSLKQELIYEKAEPAISDTLLDTTDYLVKDGDSLYKIAKHFGVTIELLKKTNSLNTDVIRLGDNLKIPSPDFRIMIDLSSKTLQLMAKDKRVAVYDVGIGKDNSTPEGKFTITEKLVNPVWYYNGEAISPDDPRNLLGSRWMGFSLKGYGIHGTKDINSIGKAESLGCIRMKTKDLEELYDLVRSGTDVQIFRQ